jgi:hypothetical protein
MDKTSMFYVLGDLFIQIIQARKTNATMNEFISTYIKEINQLYQTGLTTEHSFRPALQRLLHDCTRCTVINEQSHIDCGAPDLTLLSKQLPIAYIEAKDLEDGDLDGRKKNKEQFDRYKASLDTIIFTDYLDFHLYEHGEWQQSVRLAEIQGNKIRLSDADRFVSLMEHIKNARPQRITSHPTRSFPLLATTLTIRTPSASRRKGTSRCTADESAVSLRLRAARALSRRRS